MYVPLPFLLPTQGRRRSSSLYYMYYPLSITNTKGKKKGAGNNKEEKEECRLGHNKKRREVRWREGSQNQDPRCISY
jgi:hypothetical protein